MWIGFGLLYMCNVLLGHRSQVDAWVLRHRWLGGFLKVVRGLLPCDVWLLLQGVSLLLRGSLPGKLAPVVEVISRPSDRAIGPVGPAGPYLPPSEQIDTQRVDNCSSKW